MCNLILKPDIDHSLEKYITPLQLCIYLPFYWTYMGQSIQEWTKWNLWKTAFKNFRLVPYKEKTQLIIMNQMNHLQKHKWSAKLDSYFPKKIVLCFNESPLEMMKNAFYFILKGLFFIKIFKCCLDFLAMYKKRLD